MRRWSVVGNRLSVAFAFVAAVAGAGCGEDPPRAGLDRGFPGAEPRRSALTALPPVRFSELHYDNAGTDIGEAVEISGPAGADLTGWTVVLYNGAASAVYDTKLLSGALRAESLKPLV